MTTISAVVHTLNEERNLGPCLECLRWCTEIVIVDMSSDDRTVEVARRFTDRIFQVERMGLADPARRFGVEQCRGDWVLVVDADELIPATLAARLLDLAGRDDVDIARIPMKTYILGAWIRHTMWWPDYHERFFRRGCVVPSTRVHAPFRLRSRRITTLEADERFAIHHFNYRDSTHFIDKLNRYTDREAEAFAEIDRRRFSPSRLFVRSIFEFVLRYVYKRGFLDGWRGLFLSAYMAFYRFLAEAKLWERAHNADPAADYDRLKQNLCEGHRPGPGP